MKVSKEEQMRRTGMAYAYSIASEKGIQALAEEIRFRNITKAPIGVSRSEVERFQNEVKTNTVLTMKCLTMLVLHDEFGFGHDRLERFVERFMLKTECLIETDPNGNSYSTWAEYEQILLEECKIKCNLTEEFLQMKGDKN